MIAKLYSELCSLNHILFLSFPKSLSLSHHDNDSHTQLHWGCLQKHRISHGFKRQSQVLEHKLTLVVPDGKGVDGACQAPSTPFPSSLWSSTVLKFRAHTHFPCHGLILGLGDFPQVCKQSPRLWGMFDILGDVFYSMSSSATSIKKITEEQ